MKDVKLIRQRQERLAHRREQAVGVVLECERELDVLAGQLDQFVRPTLGDLALPPALNLFGLGGRPRRRRISR
jgi:hypothetical protein